MGKEISNDAVANGHDETVASVRHRQTATVNLLDGDTETFVVDVRALLPQTRIATDLML
jgi:hypothetical protein